MYSFFCLNNKQFDIVKKYVWIWIKTEKEHLSKNNKMQKTMYLSIICKPCRAKYTTPCIVVDWKKAATPFWIFFNSENFSLRVGWVGPVNSKVILLFPAIVSSSASPSPSRKRTFLLWSTLFMLCITLMPVFRTPTYKFNSLTVWFCVNSSRFQFRFDAFFVRIFFRCYPENVIKFVSLLFSDSFMQKNT